MHQLLFLYVIIPCSDIFCHSEKKLLNFFGLSLQLLHQLKSFSADDWFMGIFNQINIKLTYVLFPPAS